MLNIKRLILALTAIISITTAWAQQGAQILSDELTYNFGTIAEADGFASHTFTIKNTGDAPLVITRVTASCGCTRPEWTKSPIAPGKTGEVKITYNPKGRPGPFYKTVSIFSNGKKGSYSLAIKGNVTPKPSQPVFTYPYSIGDLKLHTKTVLFSSIRPEETLGEKINIKNEGKTSATIHLGKVPHYLNVQVNPATLQPDEVGAITILMDAKVLKRKGRVSTLLPVMEVMSGFLLALAAALAFHGILFVICTVLSSIFHLGAVEKCSLIYTNAGNIIMPLVAALLGEEWQIYATAFLTVQMTILFSHGQSVMEGKPGINWKKIVTNPNMIAVVAGLVLFLTPLQLPDVLADTMTSMARAVGPVSMIMLGMTLADIEWKKLFTGKRVYGMVLARMVLLPLVAVFFLRTWGTLSSVPDSRSILLVTLLAAITPTAATITQMAQLYDQDAAYASAINVMTTVVCVVTMPLMVMLYMM